MSHRPATSHCSGASAAGSGSPVWRMGLDAAGDGRVVHLDATVLEHQLEIAIADREHQIPSDRPQDHLGRELPALELLAVRHATRAAIRLVETARLSNPDPPHKFATEPLPFCALPKNRVAAAVNQGIRLTSR